MSGLDNLETCSTTLVGGEPDYSNLSQFLHSQSRRSPSADSFDSGVVLSGSDFDYDSDSDFDSGSDSDPVTCFV